jgi:molybdate transport system ATP-binding protein
MEPELLLLDEAFNALDIRLKNRMLSILDEILSERSLTVIYVSHAPEEMNRLANRRFNFSSSGQLIYLLPKSSGRRAEGFKMQNP